MSSGRIGVQQRQGKRIGRVLWPMPKRYVSTFSLSMSLILLPLQCIKVNASWAKGYARKGAALHGAKRYDEAVTAYEAGIKLEDSPALRKGLQEVKDAKGISVYSRSCN